jgi:prostaglandin-H2 D-isomerase / glutathione transferase
MAATGTSTYKLTYMDMPGSAEQIRFIFAYAGVEFTDNRIKYSEIAALKPKIPWGLVPVLEVDGEMIGESNAISEFVARRLNLGGKTDIEQARVNSVGDYVIGTSRSLSVSIPPSSVLFDQYIILETRINFSF